MPNISVESSPECPRKLHHIESEITELAAHIHAATFRLLELIREFDEHDGWCGPGLKSCAHWLNWKCGIGLGAAREKVRVAHALKNLPKISDSFRQGRISFSKVRAMTRVATPESEDFLLMIARHGTASHVEQLVRQFRKVERIEALELENQRHELRALNWYVDDDGSYVIKVRMTPEQGERIVKAIESAMDEEFEERKNVSAETSDHPATDPASDPVAQRRADALGRMAETFLGGASGTTGGDRCTIHLHTTPDTLSADGETAESTLDSRAHLSAETSRRLACDCGVVHWHEDEAGQALNVGRKTRSIPPAIRRALHRRDHGCRFPGCTAHKFVDAHHVHHWADGGETKMDNLVLLCRHHHRLVHESGFGVEMQSEPALFATHSTATPPDPASGVFRSVAHPHRTGEYASSALDRETLQLRHLTAPRDERVANKADCVTPKFTDPTGKTLPSVPETRFSGNVFALRRQNQENGLEIDPETTVSLWEGERMDYGMAVEGLLSLKSSRNSHPDAKDGP